MIWYIISNNISHWQLIYLHLPELQDLKTSNVPTNRPTHLWDHVWDHALGGSVLYIHFSCCSSASNFKVFSFPTMSSFSWRNINPGGLGMDAFNQSEEMDGNDIFLFAARILLDFLLFGRKVLSLVVISSMLPLFKSGNVHDVCSSWMTTQNLSLLGSTTQSVSRLEFIVLKEYSIYSIWYTEYE